MDIGVPREGREDEYRVGLTPAGVKLLTAAGHGYCVEHDAGRGAGFSDIDYERVGARIVYSPKEAYGRADLVLKVSHPTAEGVEWLRERCILMGFLHLQRKQKENPARGCNQAGFFFHSAMESGITCLTDSSDICRSRYRLRGLASHRYRR